MCAQGSGQLFLTSSFPPEQVGGILELSSKCRWEWSYTRNESKQKKDNISEQTTEWQAWYRWRAIETKLIILCSFIITKDSLHIIIWYRPLSFFFIVYICFNTLEKNFQTPGTCICFMLFNVTISNIAAVNGFALTTVHNCHTAGPTSFEFCGLWNLIYYVF